MGEALDPKEDQLPTENSLEITKLQQFYPGYPSLNILQVRIWVHIPA